MPQSPEVFREYPTPITGGSGETLGRHESNPPKVPEVARQIPESKERLRYIVIITRDDERTRRLEKLPRLLGSAIRYDRYDGTIYYPSYHALGTVLEPEAYLVEYPRRLRLRHQPVSSSTYLTSIPRDRRFLWEKRWNQISKEEGSVEAAIRAMDHVLYRHLIPDGDEERGMEIRQINRSVDRITQVSNLLDKYEPGMPREEFNELFTTAAQQTAELFIELGMKDVKDPAKQRIVEQLSKASIGKDSLDRPNPLIMQTRLRSALIQAMERLAKINVIRTKYFAMRVALANERRTARYLLRIQKKELSTVLGHVAFQRPERPATQLQLGIIGGKIGRIARVADHGIHLAPYKSVSSEIRYSLVPEARRLLEKGNAAEAGEVIRGMQAEIDRVLETYRRIYPEEPRDESGKEDTRQSATL